MTEFDKINDAYLKNRFSAVGQVVDVLNLYVSLSDKNVLSDKGECLYHLAARFADSEAISFLKEAGVKPVADKYGNTPLHSLTNAKFEYSGANNKIYNAAIQLLEANVNPKKKNDSGKLAYFEAGLNYNYEFIAAMCNAGISMDAVMEEGKNLLHAITNSLYNRKNMSGAMDAAYKTIKLLLDKGEIDPEDKDIFETTPLTYAQRSGEKKIAALLAGDETDIVTGGMTIHEAVLNKDEEAVKALIDSGIDLNEISDKYNRTPLMLACEYPSANILNLLAEGGADVNYKSGNGDTAIHCLLTKAMGNWGRGASQDTKDLVLMLKALLANNLNKDMPADADGNTALNMVCQAGYLADLNYNLAEELVEAGCDLNFPNNAGKTPLMSFAAVGKEMQYGIAELLIDHDADTAYIDKAGYTALMYAAGNSDKMSAKKMVSLLIKRDASAIEKVNNTGQSALDIAVKAENEAVVKMLLTNIE